MIRSASLFCGASQKVANEHAPEFTPLLCSLPYKSCLEAVPQKCSVKNVFLEISQNSQENAWARASFFNKVADLRSKNTFSYRTPPVAASGYCPYSNL